MVILENVAKTYRTARGEVHALRDVSLHIEKGEFIILSGPSGSGKTTLLMAIAAMLRPSSGSVSIEQKNIYQMSMRDRANFRAENIGFVFQMFHLVPYLNIVENVLLARRPDSRRETRGQAARVCRQADPTDRLKELLAQLGLAERALHKPAELSAGEKQRAAIARALFNRPKLILADEPTGNLDPDNATSVLGYLSEFHRAGGTVIVATHGPSAEQFADRIIYLRNGALE